MPFDFLTMSHVDLVKRRVLVRFDFNCPVDPETGDLLAIDRILDAIPTLQALESSATVILAHQGRPGCKDFITLERHCQILQQRLFKPVKYVQDVIGPTAIHEIQKIKPGQILVLENVRFLAEENLQGAPEDMARTHLVQRLAPLFDFFILDAFPVMHRSQPSIVGLACRLPTIAGISLEHEITTLARVLHNPFRPSLFILGGAKLKDKVNILKNVLKNNKADYVFLTGLMANAFLKTMSYPIDIKEPQPHSLLEYDIQQLLEKYGDIIQLPCDLACEEFGHRIEYPIDNLPIDKGPFRALDIGKKTLDHCIKLIKEAGTITANGPAGLFESPPFDKGTTEILKAIAQSKGLTVIGGGHLSAQAIKMGLNEKIKLISKGGGATINLLSGKRLPAVDVLRQSARNYLETKRYET
ncbi:MAG: phosphoglycerate kinase [Candidatus Ranarchaeia archaeon]